MNGDSHGGDDGPTHATKDHAVGNCLVFAFRQKAQGASVHVEGLGVLVTSGQDVPQNELHEMPLLVARHVLHHCLHPADNIIQSFHWGDIVVFQEGILHTFHAISNATVVTQQVVESAIPRTTSAVLIDGKHQADLAKLPQH